MHTAWSWFKRIVPPFFMLPLFAMPFDMGPHIFWLVAGIASFISLKHIVVASVRVIRSGGEDQRFLVTQLRPLLTCCIFFSALAWMAHQTSETSAELNVLARNTALQLQEACQSQGRCPETPPSDGWQLEGAEYIAKVDFMHAVFTPGKEGQTFSIRVRYRFDDNLFITGGVTAPLEEHR